MKNLPMITRTHRGSHYSATTESAIDDMIKTFEYNETVFYRSSGHGRSSHARELENGKVEVHFANHHTGERITTKYNSITDYYNNN